MATDGGYSLGQVMKFAAHRNSKTLVGHYLDDMSNVDGAAVFLGLEPRRDLTEAVAGVGIGLVGAAPVSVGPAEIAVGVVVGDTALPCTAAMPTSLSPQDKK